MNCCNKKQKPTNNIWTWANIIYIHSVKCIYNKFKHPVLVGVLFGANSLTLGGHIFTFKTFNPDVEELNMDLL